MLTAWLASPCQSLEADFQKRVQQREAVYREIVQQQGIDGLLSVARGGVGQNNAAPGRQLYTVMQDGQPFYFMVQAPDSVSQHSPHAVVFYLHGGVNSQRWKRNGAWWRGADQLIEPGTIAVFPAGWAEARWWSEKQGRNLLNILDYVKMLYPVDPNRVFIAGISDGASGAFFLAPRLATKLAGSMAIIGSPSVIAGPANGARDETYPLNMGLVRWLVINAANDPLYPPEQVRPFLEYFTVLGASVQFETVAGSHSVESFDRSLEFQRRFTKLHSRNPYPASVRFQTNSTSAFQRAYWLEVDSVSTDYSGHMLQGLMRSRQPSGLVEATYAENEFRVTAHGINRLSLYISPDQVNLGLPVHVYINERDVYNQLVVADPEVLVRSFAREQDPSQLYVQRLTFDLQQAK